MPFERVESKKEVRRKRTGDAKDISVLDWILEGMNAHSSPGKSKASAPPDPAMAEVKKTFQLYSFDMIPDYLQSNPYIRRGYRYGLTFKGCLIR